MGWEHTRGPPLFDQAPLPQIDLGTILCADELPTAAMTKHPSPSQSLNFTVGTTCPRTGTEAPGCF